MLQQENTMTSESEQEPALPSPGEGEEITPVSQETPQAGEGGERVEVDPDHDRAIEQAIQSVGVRPEDVSPDDIVLAAEYHAQGMDPTQAFQQAVIMNAKFDKEKRIACAIVFAATWFDKEQQDAFVAAYEKLDIALKESTRQFYERSNDGGHTSKLIRTWVPIRATRLRLQTKLQAGNQPISRPGPKRNSWSVCRVAAPAHRLRRLRRLRRGGTFGLYVLPRRRLNPVS